MNTSKIRIVEDGNESLQAQKKFLRSRMKGVRAEVVNRDQKSRAFTANALWYIEQKKSRGERVKKVFVYLSFSSELSTDLLVEALQNEGFEVYAPVTEKEKMNAVRVGEDFSISKFGIREPIGETLTGSPDLIFAPLLAVDKHGNRLGYGGGYYDRFLAECKNRGDVVDYVGCAFDCQRIERVPTDGNDQPLTAVVTENGVTVFGAKEGENK